MTNKQGCGIIYSQGRDTTRFKYPGPKGYRAERLTMNNLGNNFKPGDYVVCFEYFAIVREVDDLRGLLLENPRIGKWYAKPEFCTPYIPPVEEE